MNSKIISFIFFITLSVGVNAQFFSPNARDPEAPASKQEKKGKKSDKNRSDEESTDYEGLSREEIQIIKAEQARKEKLEEANEEEQEDKKKGKRKNRPKFDDIEEAVAFDIQELNSDDDLINSEISTEVPDGFKSNEEAFKVDMELFEGIPYPDEGMTNPEEDIRLAYRYYSEIKKGQVPINLIEFAGGELESYVRVDKAIELFENEYYSSTLALLLPFYESQAKNASLNYLLGISFLNAYNNNCESIKYLKRAAASAPTEGGRQGDVYYYYERSDAIYALAQAYHRCGYLDKAQQTYQTYMDGMKFELYPEDPEYVGTQLAQLQIEQAKRWAETSPKKFAVRNLSEINSFYPEFTVRPYKNNTLYFSTIKDPERVPLPSEEVDEEFQIHFTEKRFFTDIYKSSRSGDGWSKPEKVNKINSPYDDWIVGLNNDGDELYYYNQYREFLNFRQSTASNGNWQASRVIFTSIPFAIDKNGMAITDNGRTVIFAANLYDSFGGMDLYITKQNPDKTWTEPKNLGEDINTEYDEISPFIHPNGATLYFSHNGPTSIGGYDVFKATLVGNSVWENPTNLGYSVNTFTDDVSYSITDDGHYAYVCRPGEKGDFDIFEINYFENNNNLGGFEKPSFASAPEGDLVLTNLVTGLSTKHAINPKTGLYNIELEPCVNYTLKLNNSTSDIVKQETFMTPCELENKNLYINPKTDIGKIQIRLTEENGKNFRGADNRKDNQWQVLVDNRPYRFEGYRVNLNDENGKLITQIRLDAMGKFDLKDLNFQEPTFEVQVMDIDICDRLTVKNLNTGKIRYPECFQK